MIAQEHSRTSLKSGVPMTFAEYLKAAVEKALADDASGADNGELRGILDHCQKGVRHNHACLDSTTFLEAYLWCVGSIQKDYDVRTRHRPQVRPGCTSYWESQMDLFRQCDAQRIVGEAVQLRCEWENAKCYMNKKMVDSVLFVAAFIVADGWDVFKKQYLPLPADPEAETAEAWSDAYWLLDQFPLVDEAIAWYLIRNLYGGPFFKPDVHIKAIAQHFFTHEVSPVDALAVAARREWPTASTDSRLQPVHLGVVDYVLWWYRRSTGTPE